MFDLIRKAMLTGVGLAVMTKEKIEELGRDLAKNAELSEQEGKEFVDDLLQRSDQARKDFETKVSQATTQVVESMPVATKADIRRLEERIAQLEQRLSSGVS